MVDLQDWVRDIDAALSAYPNEPEKRHKVLMHYFSVIRTEAIRAFIEHPNLKISYECRKALMKHLEK